MTDADQVTNALARLFHVPSLTFSGVRRGVSNAVERAHVASARSRFPVLVFLQGACGFRAASMFQVQELVSHGYVVVAPDQPYTAACVTFPDGRRVDMPPTEEVRPLTRQGYLPAPESPVLNGVPLAHGVIPFLGQDVSFVLDRLEELSAEGAEHPLAGRLDLSRIGLAGLSLGGIVAAEAARADERVRATLIMDAPVPVRTVAAGLGQPTMWLTRPADTMRGERQRAGGWSEEEIEAHHATMRTTFDSLRAPGYFVQVPDISHLDFTDVPAWSPVPGWLGLTGPRDAAYAHEIINAYGRDFFGRHLLGLPGPLLDGPGARFPDVTIDLHEPIT